MHKSFKRLMTQSDSSERRPFINMDSGVLCPSCFARFPAEKQPTPSTQDSFCCKGVPFAPCPACRLDLLGLGPGSPGVAYQIWGFLPGCSTGFLPGAQGFSRMIPYDESPSGAGDL